MSSGDEAQPQVVLENELARAPDDSSRWDVYRDYLLERGDVRGELIAIAQRDRLDPRDKSQSGWSPVREFVEKHREQLFGGLPLDYLYYLPTDRHEPKVRAPVDHRSRSNGHSGHCTIRFGVFGLADLVVLAAPTLDALVGVCNQYFQLPVARFTQTVRLQLDSDCEAPDWFSRPTYAHERAPCCSCCVDS